MIAPSTNLRILKNVPLEREYDHTIYFGAREAQLNYFFSLQYLAYNNMTYQRVGSNKIKVGIPIDTLYGYNYLMFRNTSYENRWFFCFLNKLEYVNDNCTIIEYEVDVMQTFHFDYVLTDCFVEREHSQTDVIGEHIEAEPISVGEYVYNNYEKIIGLDDMCVIISVVDVDGGVIGSKYDGVYSGAKLYAFNMGDSGVQSEIDSFLQNYIQAPEKIISMYTCPLWCIGVIPQNHLLTFGDSGSIEYFTKTPISENDTIDVYNVKNNKLYTYPYNFYCVDNANGDSLILRYEFFENLTPKFTVDSCITSPVNCRLRPSNYKGLNSSQSFSGYTNSHSEILNLNNFPLCSWSFDSYQAFISQNAIPIVLKNLGDITNVTPTGLSKNVTNLLALNYQKSIQADIFRGNTETGNVNVANTEQTFYGGRMSVTRQQAIVIDDFFTKYGYAVNRTKTPNRTSRPHWNYVKTNDCQITCSIPSEFSDKIKANYNNGITFWKNASEIGNYTLDNSPVNE